MVTERFFRACLGWREWTITGNTGRSGFRTGRILRRFSGPPWSGSPCAASKSWSPRCTTSSSSRWGGTQPMHKLLMVIRREYLERVRKRSFWFGTLLLPLLMVGLVVVQLFLVDLETGKQGKVALVDATGKLSSIFESKLAEEKTKDGKPIFLVEVAPVAGSLEETRRRLE